MLPFVLTTLACVNYNHPVNLPRTQSHTYHRAKLRTYHL